jgi:hypothetical protein
MSDLREASVKDWRKCFLSFMDGVGVKADTEEIITPEFSYKLGKRIRHRMYVLTKIASTGGPKRENILDGRSTFTGQHSTK